MTLFGTGYTVFGLSCYPYLLRRKSEAMGMLSPEYLDDGWAPRGREVSAGRPAGTKAKYRNFFCFESNAAHSAM